MKLTFMVLGFVCITGYSQDTLNIYVDKNYNQVDKSKAIYEREVIIGKDYYKISDRDLEGRMTNSVEFRSIDPWIEHGQAVHYVAPDSLYSKGNYDNGEIAGEWIYYNGKITDTVYYLPLDQYFNLNECPNSQYYSNNKDLKVIGELILDSLGNFMKENFHMPARTKGFKKVFAFYINLLIDKEGKVKCPNILNPIQPDIASEIFRILHEFKYETGLKKAIKLDFTFPYNEDGDPNDNIYIIVEQMPTFLGGDQNQFRKYIEQNLRYPASAAAKGISGTVFVQFVVSSLGDVVDAKVMRSVDPDLDAEALRVIKSSPRWEPGLQRGKPVNVQFTFPIVFVYK